MSIVTIMVIFSVLYTIVGVLKSLFRTGKKSVVVDEDNEKIEKQRKESITNTSGKLIKFLYWKIQDIKKRIKHGKTFDEYGLTIYCGRQGAGKTMSMVQYLEEMRWKYPHALIGTNFGYKNQDFEIEDWQQFYDVRNGENGVIFAFDEIQNEWDSSKWDKFPDGLLRQITMQRKQKIKIVATSQVFTRVVKALREQTFEVVECYTLLGRWTFCKCFDADEYNAVIDSPEKKRKLYKKWKKSYIQTDNLRNLYDTWLVIEKLRRMEPGQKAKERRILEQIG